MSLPIAPLPVIQNDADFLNLVADIKVAVLGGANVGPYVPPLA